MPLPGTNPFSLWVLGFIQPFPEFQRADSNSCLSGKGGDAETRKNITFVVSALVKEGNKAVRKVIPIESQEESK